MTYMPETAFILMLIILSIVIKGNHATLIDEKSLHTTTPSIHPAREADTYQALSRILGSQKNIIFLNTTRYTNITSFLPLAEKFPRLQLDRTDDVLPMRFPVTGGPQPTGVTKFPPYVWRYMPVLNISDTFGSNVEAGRYPIIYVNLQGISSGSYARIVEWVKDRIKCAFKDHRYLIEAFAKIMRDRVNNARDEIFQAQKDLQLFFKIFRFIVTEEEVAHSLSYLSRILYNHFRQRVIIFIDHFDDIANNLTGKSNVLSNYDKMRTIKFLKYFYTNTAKLNIYAKKIVFIGSISNIDEKSFVQKHDIKEHYTYPNLYQFYSFPKPKLDILFEYFPKWDKMETTTKAEWNDVYRKRHKIEGDFYDALDIDQFMEVKFETNFWADVYYIDFLIENALKSDLFRNLFIDVLRCKTIKVDEQAALIINETNTEPLRNHIFDEYNLKTLDKHTADLIFVFLYQHGYLTATQNASLGSKIITLQISQITKIRTELSIMLMKYYKAQHNITRKDFLEAIRNFGDFMSTDNETSTSLKYSLENIFRRFIPHGRNEIITRQAKEVIFFVSHIPLRYPDYAIRQDIESDDPFTPEIILTSKERAVLFNFEVGTVANDQSTIVLKELKKCKDLIRKLEEKNLKVKLIGIHISPNATVDVHAETTHL